MAAEKLNIFKSIPFNESIVKEELRTYLPFRSGNIGYSDEIRIPIQSRELITDTSNSYIYIEGKFTNNDATVPKPACHMTNNAICFLFDEIRYEISGHKVDICRMPGITSSLKGYVSYPANESKKLSHSGWSPGNEPLQILNADTETFSAILPLKHLFGFAEDYQRVIVNMSQELVLIRSRSDVNTYKGAATSNGKIEITKLAWKVPHITLSDSEKIKLFERLNRNSEIAIAFRQWELYDMPTLKRGKSEVWPIKVSSQLEKPRWMLIAFQQNHRDNKQKAAGDFISASITNLRTHLNANIYPYEDMKLNFTTGDYQAAYWNYINFQSNYYGTPRNEPLFSYEEFKQCPIFVIDCTKQTETLKNSIVDVKLEMEALQDFPAGSTAYCLIIHDTVIHYNPATEEVRRL